MIKQFQVCYKSPKEVNQKIIVFVFCLSILYTTLFSQTKKYLFKTEIGTAASTVYDNGYSLTQYKGRGINAIIGGERERKNRLTSFTNIFILTPLKSVVKNKTYQTSAQQYNYCFSYTYLQKAPTITKAKIKLAFGGTYFADVNIRIYSTLVNNVLSFDGNSGISLTGKAQKDFQFKSHFFLLGYQLSVPVFAYNVRPNYLGTIPIGYYFNSDVKYSTLGKFTTINNNYFYLNQYFSLDKISSNGNRIRLSYFWNYSNNGYSQHRYQNIINGISIGILSNFSKSPKTVKSVENETK